MAFRFYTDSALTNKAFDIPIGSAVWAYPLSRLSTFTAGGETYYYHASHWASGWDDFSNVNGDGVDVTGINYRTALYTDGLSVSEIYDQTPPANMIIGSWYSHGTTLNKSTGSGNRNMIAIRFTCEGVAMFAIGSTYEEWGQHKFGAAVIFSENCLGEKAFTHPYMDESHGLNDGNGESWGGTGTIDRSTDNITLPTMPDKLSPFNLASGRGTHVYVIDGEAFDSLTGYFWGVDSSLFTSLWQKWQNLRFNPAAAILACHALPAAFTPFGDTDISQIYLAGTSLTPIAGFCRAVTSSQFIQYPASPVYHSINGLIDFTDFSGVEIVVHVPFCGRCIVPVSACMGGVGSDGEYHSGGIAVVYRCDILTGNLCAFILCRDRNGNEACVQTLTGNCAYQIPITGNDNGAGHILGALTSTAVGAVTGNVGAVLSGAAALGFDTAQRHTAIIGNHGGSAGILTNLQCYFEITYTEYSNPANYSDVRGRPSDLGGTVGEQNGIAYSGLTVFENAHVHDIRCTPEERAEIEMLLKEGVYL